MMRSLKRFFQRLKGSTDSESDEAVQENERITRYILNRNGSHSVTKGIVKPRAFLPPPNNQESVYRTSGVVEQEIWDIGDTYVAKPQGKTIYARGDVSAKDVFGVDLQIQPDTRPHRLHANIVGWPEEKEEKMKLATELANAATLRLPP